MTLIAAVGQSSSLDGREAGAKAARQALDRMGRTPVALAWVIVDDDYSVAAVLNGVAGLLGETPLLGFSTSAELSSAGALRRSVVVALLGGSGVQARADWWPDFGADNRASILRMLQALQPQAEDASAWLVACDGLSGDVQQLCNLLPSRPEVLGGCLAGGGLHHGRTYQIGGRQCGPGGLAAATLSGPVVASAGAGHGWQPVGPRVSLSKIQGMWVRAMNDERPNAYYARVFGYDERDWVYSPLAELVRQYPLGILNGEASDAAGPGEPGEMTIRSPLRMEADGSLRMNTELPEGQRAAVLVGTAEACLAAAKRAAEQALLGLDGAKPVLGLLFVDEAWQTLFAATPGAEVAAVKSVLGPDVPLAGGYTYGQLFRPRAGDRAEMLNQHIEVLLFAEKGEEE